MRVFQDFATIDLLSGGRAEIMAGRGSFIESFPLFGYDLNDYDALFDEKLRMLLAVRDAERLTWAGEHTQRVEDRGVYPRPVQDPLPVWVAVGGAPESAIRAGAARAPDGARDHRRDARAIHAVRGAAPRGGAAGRARAAAAEHQLARLRRGTWEQAVEESFPHAAAMMNAIGRERGWPPMTLADYEAAAALRGANFVGSPQQVVDKILYQHELFGHDRFLVQFASARCRTTGCCARSSCSAPRSRRRFATSWRVAPRPEPRPRRRRARAREGREHTAGKANAAG